MKTKKFLKIFSITFFGLCVLILAIIALLHFFILWWGDNGIIYALGLIIIFMISIGVAVANN